MFFEREEGKVYVIVYEDINKCIYFWKGVCIYLDYYRCMFVLFIIIFNYENILRYGFVI